MRINSVDETEHWRRDLTALDGAVGLLGIVLAKTENASHVDVTAARLPAGTPVIAMIESAAALDHSRAVAASDATARLAFGVGDYRRDTGIGADPLALAHPRSVLTHHSRLAGIAAPIDGPTPEIDLARLRNALAETAAMGHTGRLCLRPEQVPVINAELSPSEQDLGWAERTGILRIRPIGGSAPRDRVSRIRGGGPRNRDPAHDLPWSPVRRGAGSTVSWMPYVPAANTFRDRYAQILASRPNRSTRWVTSTLERCPELLSRVFLSLPRYAPAFSAGTEYGDAPRARF
ncbi:HpcH/HpaI aldolase/citrate lyase family protein [Rhodococcus sp. NPDC059968]|uniref:HpcH/HpaI aldolase/citrate lyase family protein n=1 Tax=Rhodococcus sp. NPDC059968 TaxID=3347017 RepID=UPI00366B0D4E